MHEHVQMILDLLTMVSLLFGLFFMTLGAVGLWRLPDFYHRVHAASKGITLGVTGLLVAAMFNLSTHQEATVVNIVTKVALVILFQFVANPVGAHLLAKAAHLDGCPQWEGTLSDELAEDLSG